MSDKINAFFQLLEGRFGLLPTSVATIAFVIVLVLALLLLYSLLKLRSARQVIHQFGERLGYDPPYGDGLEILHEEIGKDILLRGREVKIKQLEEHVADLETVGYTKDANITVLQKRAKELEGQLQQASFQNDKSLALANEQLQTHRTSIGRLEQRIHDMDAENTASLTGLQRRTKELEGQLQQASIQNESLTSQALEQEQSYRTAMEQLEQRMRQMEAEGSAYLSSVEQRAKELEEQLQQATSQHDELMAQAGELERAHQTAVEHFEERTREMEAESIANLTTLRQRFNELEDQLQQASLKNEELTAQAGEQAHAHQSAVEQLEQHIREMEAGHNGNLEGLHQRARELEEQLQHASFRNEELTAQAGQLAQAHQSAVEQLEQRIHEMEAGHNGNLDGLQQRARELEEQLHHASFRNEELTAQAGQQAQAHQSAVEQFEQRIREMEAGHNGNLDGLQQRARELEEQLHHASFRNEELTAQAGQQAQAHQSAVEQFEQRIREMEAGHNGNLEGLQQRARELEEQLQHASFRNEELTAQAGEQANAHQSAVEQFEQRIREMEAGHNGNLEGLHQRARELEEQLQHASFRNDEMTAQAGEQANAHQSAVEQLEQRIRDLEAGNSTNLDGLHQRARELEEQLRHASFRNDELTAQAGQQAQAHQSAVEQLEQRIRETEAGSDTTLAALQQRSRELEEQLQKATTRIENEKSTALQEALERSVETERLELRIRDLEAEKGIEESRAGTLELQIKELEDQLRRAADRAPLEIANSSKMEVANGVVSVNISEALLRRAEWITGCAVGAILPHGLIAAEAYASAALAANPQDIDASHLLSELGRIRRAYPEGLPPVIESVTTFDERAAAFFAADLVHAADIADDEAQRRYRAGLNRSALLVVNMAIELRQQTSAEDSPDMLRLQEMKASLLARLGNNAKTSNAAPKVTS